MSQTQNPLFTYRSGVSIAREYCFLRFLKITHLDIKYTSIASLSHIQGMELENVDIRHTRIKDLHPHEATRDINTAIISPGQFSKKALNHLPPAVKIIEKD